MKHILLSVLFGSLVFGQLKSDLPGLDLPQNMHILPPSSSFSLFNSNRFDMQHSFSMSMVSMGGQSIGVGSYTNSMSYYLMNNLRLRADITLMQPTFQSGLNPNNVLSGQMYYGAALDYQPTENTFLHISFHNYPTYHRSRTSPFFLETY